MKNTLQGGGKKEEEEEGKRFDSPSPLAYLT